MKTPYQVFIPYFQCKIICISAWSITVFESWMRFNVEHRRKKNLFSVCIINVIYTMMSIMTDFVPHYHYYRVNWLIEVRYRVSTVLQRLKYRCATVHFRRWTHGVLPQIFCIFLQIITYYLKNIQYVLQIKCRNEAFAHNISLRNKIIDETVVYNYYRGTTCRHSHDADRNVLLSLPLADGPLQKKRVVHSYRIIRNTLDHPSIDVGPIARKIAPHLLTTM